MRHTSYRILPKFAYLFGAHWVREVMRTVFLIILARQSSTTYGEFMLALSIGYILLFVAESGLNQHLVPLLTQKGGDHGDALAQISILKGILLLLGCMGLLGFVQWQEYPSNLKALVFVIGIGVGLEALGSSFFVACQVQGRQDAEGKVKTVAATFGFGYGLAMLIAGAGPLLVGFFKGIETLANLVGAVAVSLRKTRLKLRWPNPGDLWVSGKEGTVFTLMATAAILYNKSNIFFLQQYAGPEGVAQYSVTWEIVDGVSCITSSLLLKNVLFPLFVNLWEGDREELGRLVKEATRWLMAVSIPIMFVLAVESDRLIPLLYGPNYSHAVEMQRYLVLTIMISFLHNLAAYLMISMKRHRLLLVFYVAGLFFNLLLCWSIIPGRPLAGAAMAIILTKALVAIATISFGQARFGLFDKQSVLHLLWAVLLGGGLYFGGKILFFREAGEVLALVPTAILSFRWRSALSGWRSRTRA